MRGVCHTIGSAAIPSFSEPRHTAANDAPGTSGSAAIRSFSELRHTVYLRPLARLAWVHVLDQPRCLWTGSAATGCRLPLTSSTRKTRKAEDALYRPRRPDLAPGQDAAGSGVQGCRLAGPGVTYPKSRCWDVSRPRWSQRSSYLSSRACPCLSAYADTMKVSLGTDDGDDVVSELAAVSEAKRVLARREEVAVRRARNRGLSWAEIGTLLGVTRQSMHRKYRRVG